MKKKRGVKSSKKSMAMLRREFEYIRHGTLSWLLNFDVVTGHVIEPSWGSTRTEEDALAHLQRLIASDPKASSPTVYLYRVRCYFHIETRAR